MAANIKQKLLSEIFAGTSSAKDSSFDRHREDLIRHHFAQLLHRTDSPAFTLPTFVDSTEDMVPAEEEVAALLARPHGELFLQNIWYHLRRNRLRLPGSLLPFLLTRFRSEPGTWRQIYRHFPELVLPVARLNDDWEYMSAAFDPEYTPRTGSPLFYETMVHRIRQYPERSAAFVRDSFSRASEYHQPRLIELLGYDPHPDTVKFLRSALPDSRKAVRLKILEILLRQKHPEIYDPLQEALADGSSTLKHPRKPYSKFRPDLSSLSGETDPREILIALTDPADIPGSASQPLTSSLKKAALRFKHEKILVQWLDQDPETEQIQEILKIVPKASLPFLIRQKYIERQKSPDLTFFRLLSAIRPFTEEKLTREIWHLMKNILTETPFYFIGYPMEIWALRIHPNLIREIWQDPVLQSTEKEIAALRDLLKYRLAFLKKCYK